LNFLDFRIFKDLSLTHLRRSFALDSRFLLFAVFIESFQFCSIYVILEGDNDKSIIMCVFSCYLATLGDFEVDFFTEPVT